LKDEHAYLGGVVFTRQNLLDRIKVYAGGIAYRTYSTSTERNYLYYDQLTSITEYSGDDSKQHSSIRFTYDQTSIDVIQDEITTNLGLENIEQRNAETVSLDLTGNGKMDFVVYPKTVKNKFWVFKDLQKGSFNYPLEVNSGSFENIFPVSWLTHNNKILSGQGLAVVQNVANNQVKFKVYSNGTTYPIYYQYEKVWDAPTYTQRTSCYTNPTTHRIPQQYVSGDFNGDGLSDIIAISKPYSYYNCRERIPCDDGGGFPQLQQNSNSILDSINGTIDRIRPPIDDGCCDCNTTSINYSNASYINLDRRVTSNFVKSLGYFYPSLKSTDKLLTADVNGDGKTDILHITEGKIYVYNLDNNGNLQQLWQLTDPLIKLDFPLLLGDYNGDGKTDFMIPHAVGSKKFYTFLSTGNSFTKGSYFYQFTYREYLQSGSTIYGYNLIATDINGDGRTDIIDYQTTTYNNSTNGTQKILTYHNHGIFGNIPSLMYGGSSIKTGNLKHFPIPIFLSSDKPNTNLDFASISNKWITAFSFTKDHRKDVLLRSIENNGVTHNINYNNLDPEEQSEDYIQVYRKAYSETYPNVDVEVAPGTKVVTFLERVHSGTPTLKQVYSYYGAVYNVEGLGFLGFKGVAKSNWHTSSSDRIFNVSKYSTEQRGAAIENYVQPYYFSFTTIPSDYISKTSYTNAHSLSSNKVFKVWNSSNVTQNSLEGTVTNKSFSYDVYNNPTKIITNYSSQGSSVIDIDYANNTGSNYYIGRPTTETETKIIGGNAFTTERQFSYSGYLLTQKKTKGNGTNFDTETYTYDAFGNITKKTTTPYNTTAREVNFEYDNSGRYLTKSIDVEGLETIYQYNINEGTLKKEINPFGQETQYLYDAWNRLTTITDYLGKNAITSYVETNNNYTVTVSADDGSSKIEIYDPLKRLTTVKEKDVLGQWISKSYQYDKFDRISEESEPYTGSGASQWNTTQYDFYGRPTTVTSYTGKVTNLSYNNLSVTIDDGTKTVTTTKNAMGNVLSVTDPGGTINYTYYGNGTMKTVNYDGVIISTEQDGWGRKTKTTDPSAGVYTYEYNGFGEITKETTPKGVTDYTYSPIGKLVQKKIVGSADPTNMTIQYAYNTTNKMVSAITLTNADGNNSSYTYTYDNQQRLNYTKESNASAQFTKRYTYDTFGRIATEENEAKLLVNNKTSIKKIKNTYQNGSLKTISDNATQEVLWNIEAINARGQATSITMGNNLRKTNTYNQSGYLTESKSEKEINTTPVQLMSLTFDFNAQKGTLNSRTNSLFAWTENFTYDNMNRLVSFNDNDGNKSQSYDNQGRITNNPNAGTYSYTGKSYQVASISTNTVGHYHFEDIVQQDVTYNAFKSPIEIKVAGKDHVSFQYNAFNGRATLFYGDTEDDKLLRPYRKHYSFDGSMEISYEVATGKTTFVTYIGGDAYNAPAIWRSEQGATSASNYYFLHRDYLGSILMISDKNGAIKEKRHFDAWGNIVKLQDGIGNDLSSFKIIDRGYTGHEHLLGVGLIHMNGRLYDPMLHRFLAPDNYIQDPYNTQNYNRYGYVLNNPLMYTDPSGEVAEWVAGIIVGAFIYAAIQVVKMMYDLSKTDSGSGYVNNNSPINLNPNSSTSAIEPSGIPIRDGGFNANVPVGVFQGNWLESSTSSSIAYNTTGPNDWIANGNSLGGNITASEKRNGFWNFVEGVGNGFWEGGKSTVDFVKSLGTKKGWSDLGKGIVNSGAMSHPLDPYGQVLRTQTGIAVTNYIDNVPNMSHYELGQSFGYGVEKVAEIAITRRVVPLPKSYLGLKNVGNASRYTTIQSFSTYGKWGRFSTRRFTFPNSFTMDRATFFNRNFIIPSGRVITIGQLQYIQSN